MLLLTYMTLAGGGLSILLVMDICNVVSLVCLHAYIIAPYHFVPRVIYDCVFYSPIELSLVFAVSTAMLWVTRTSRAQATLDAIKPVLRKIRG